MKWQDRARARTLRVRERGHGEMTDSAHTTTGASLHCSPSVMSSAGSSHGVQVLSRNMCGHAMCIPPSVVQGEISLHSPPLMNELRVEGHREAVADEGNAGSTQLVVSGLACGSSLTKTPSVALPLLEEGLDLSSRFVSTSAVADEEEEEEEEEEGEGDEGRDVVLVLGRSPV